MSNTVDCAALDSFVTPYLDGALEVEASEAVERHLGRCSSCRGRVDQERAALALLRQHRAVLTQETAPSALHALCRAHATLSATLPAASVAAVRRPEPRPMTWRTRATPFALAASLVLLVGGAFLVQATRASSRLMVAELTADHLKCFAMNAVMRTHQASEAVENSMAAGFAWDMHLPSSPEREGLELVGSRPCLYAEGKMAHIMYRYHGKPVSLFMLPRTKRSEQLVEVLGHEAAIWSVGDRTFVLIAREARSEVERMAAFVHAALR